MKRLDLLGGAALGGTVVYLFDPAQGAARRRRLAARIHRGARALIDVTTGRKRGALDQWEIPMATVDIDIDQGIVTLHGAFPPDETEPVQGKRRFTTTGAPVRLVEEGKGPAKL